ncbi:hypothetical protein QBC37DRAFT_441071 [Rhypophila decipiens]|uniref:Uncharacterized protein n=1 Tax=Rhypophila decipiens TaxID=261697 RepID=A0AAN6Y5U6_9PEZI|nr:hypothetical protein QBC37DRAFT_441071 [Rhypophila decipiens]
MSSPKQHDDSAMTRRACLVGLVIGWFFGIGCLVLGSIFLYLEVRDGTDMATRIGLSHNWREFLTLFLNAIVTQLTDSMGYIHACTLRWALHSEGLLDFNSNLRLFRVSKYSKANGWLANGINFAGILLAYGSTSLIFLCLNPELARLLDHKYESDEVEGVHINSIAVMMLGAGLLAQAIIATWAVGTTHIPTWSSNPLDVVRACIMDEHVGHRIEPRLGRCMMSVHLAKEDAQSLRPSPKQGPMIKADIRIFRILLVLWATPIIGVLWGGVIYQSIVKGYHHGVLGRSWAMIPIFTGITDVNCDTSHCTDGSSVLHVIWTANNGTQGVLFGVFLILAAQSIVTVFLLCAELIVNLSRDEEIYRELIGPKGTNSHFNSVWAAMTSWKMILLFALKACVHWMFGLAINMQFQLGVNIYPPQVFYFAIFALITAIFGLYLSCRQPEGYLPATYGHIQTMADVIDEWSDSGCMFWGEKDPGDRHRGIPGYTGTSTERLPAPDERQFYGGQRELTDFSTLRRKGSKMSVSSRASRSNRPSIAAATAAAPWTSYPQQRPGHEYRTDSVHSAHSGYSSFMAVGNKSTEPLVPGYHN